ncbi:MAG TPA: hypothetical protein VJP80_06375 [Candidatus Saccharimonadales bacterium]|nr:hypothetical protein [Candidatus Saccharimonadales bacterium]
MELRGKPYVPPGCPRRLDHEIPEHDLSQTPFELLVHECTTGAGGVRLELEFYGEFQHGIGRVRSDDLIATEDQVVPIESDLAHTARQLADDPGAVAHMGAVFRERISFCHGVVDGECWALGLPAVEEVTRQLGEELGYPPPSAPDTLY